MVNERLKCLCVLVVSFSLALAACGGGAAEVSREGGPVPVQAETRAPTAEPTQRPTPVIKGKATPEGIVTDACTVTEPVWAKPPEDAAVPDTPGYGYYYVNEDGSMWASAWWTEEKEYQVRASEEGVKVGWFRPEGATLEISGQRLDTGRRLDAKAPALDAHVPCCYPTRFQATGLIFPTEGCWQVTARAAESVLSFVVWVEP